MGAQTFYPETVFNECDETSSKAKPKISSKELLELIKILKKKYRSSIMNYSTTLY